jgi:hypothetical protein
VKQLGARGGWTQGVQALPEAALEFIGSHGLGSFIKTTFVSIVGRRELWEPWANDPESFERAVLADLEQSVGGHTPELMREPAGREFRGARLDGSYPNTEIVVSYLDLKTGKVRETRFPVWKEGWGPRIRKENFDPPERCARHLDMAH